MKLFRVLIILLILAWPITSVQAQDPKELIWERYDVDLKVERDGRMQVAETQQIRFISGEWQNGGRTIPLARMGSVSQLQVFEIEPDGEQPVPSATAIENNELQIAWRFAVAGPGDTRTFRIKYLVEGVIRVYPDNQQIRWIAVPNERRFPVENSTVTLQLPQGVAAQDLKLESYPERLRGMERPTSAGAVFEVRNINAFDGFEVRAQFPAGTIRTSAPDWQAEADRQDMANETAGPRRMVFTAVKYLVIVPTLGIIGLAIFWFTRNR